MFILISKQILKMFLLMLLGFFCFRKRLISREGNLTLSNLLLLIINPAIILDSFQIDYSPALMHKMAIAFLLGLLAHLIGLIPATLLFRKKQDPEYGIERFSAVYSNCGFMGIPLISAVFGSEGVVLLTSYIVIFNILSWTHGLMMITGDTSRKQLVKGLTSPVMFSIAVGLGLFTLRIPLPEVLGDAVSYVAVMNTPVAMMLAGSTLASSDAFLETLKHARLYLTIGCKLLLMPLLSLAVFLLIPADPAVRTIVLIAAACPTATTGTMLALKYGKDPSYAASLFTLSTLTSMMTIPMIVYLCERVLMP